MFEIFLLSHVQSCSICRSFILKKSFGLNLMSGHRELNLWTTFTSPRKFMERMWLNIHKVCQSLMFSRLQFFDGGDKHKFNEYFYFLCFLLHWSRYVKSKLFIKTVTFFVSFYLFVGTWLRRWFNYDNAGIYWYFYNLKGILVAVKYEK